MRRAISVALFFVAACATPIEPTPATFTGRLETQIVELEGWLDTRGELRLFVSKTAMERDEEYPQCVSGISENHSSKKFSSFDRKRVRVNATVWDYESLPNESDYELARKVLANSIITNWCKSPKVLLVTQVRLSS